MLDIEFCEYLEHELTKAFNSFQDNAIKLFWCDGILLPTSEKEFSPKTVNDKREITTTAFIGKDGQDKYELKIIFGNKSLSRYMRNLDIKNCVPNSTNKKWFEIDPENKRIVIHLL